MQCAGSSTDSICGRCISNSSNEDPVKKRLELEAKSAPEVSVGGNKQNGVVTCADRHVPLREQVAYIRLNFHMSREDARQGLAYLHAQIWLQVIERLAVRILARNGRTA